MIVLWPVTQMLLASWQFPNNRYFEGACLQVDLVVVMVTKVLFHLKWWTFQPSSPSGMLVNLGHVGSTIPATAADAGHLVWQYIANAIRRSYILFPRNTSLRRVPCNNSSKCSSHYWRESWLGELDTHVQVLLPPNPDRHIHNSCPSPLVSGKTLIIPSLPV